MPGWGVETLKSQGLFNSSSDNSNTPSDSYDTLYDTFGSEFEDFEQASALLWWGTDSEFGVRVEVPSLGKEFSNGMSLGRGQRGLLFYNKRGDLEKDVHYNIYSNTDSDSPAFVIEFYNKGSTSAQSFAKFLTHDYDRIVQRTVGTATGTWTYITASESAGRLTKNSTSNTVTLTVPSIFKQVTFKENGAKAPINDASKMDTLGEFIWKDINKISNGVYVDYKDGCFVFTDTSKWSTDFCGFFLPRLSIISSEAPDDESDDDSQPPHLVRAKATWSSTT